MSERTMRAGGELRAAGSGETVALGIWKNPPKAPKSRKENSS